MNQLEQRHHITVCGAVDVQTVKTSARIECISIKEEVEQALIDKSVNVKLNLGYSEARLPFLCDPKNKIAKNEHIAERIYFRQAKILNKNPNDKLDVINAMQKLQNLGFIDLVSNLTKEQQHRINSSSIQHFIPWRAVWNPNSVSFPCRPCFDASCPTDTGLSLNNLLAKGTNNMNHLVQIFIRWRVQNCGYHTDIQKMYNSIRLVEEHWCYQLFLFHSELNPNIKPFKHVIKTLIYGITSSGNQAERAVRETANLCKDEYPRENDIIQNDLYVDDCISGESSYERAKEVTDDLQVVLQKGGFSLKGITFSGFDPPEHLCNEDKKSVNVAGIKWFSKEDNLSLNIGDLNFSKKVRGKKTNDLKGIIPDRFTRRECAGRAGEIYDFLGMFTPLVGEIKLDLSELSKRTLDWDDFVPDDLIPKWRKNFEIISAIKEIRFKRCVVPEDAVNLDIETIEMADSSLNIACSAVYVRFKRKNGFYSCQLIFARSKIIPENTSIPRAELIAAVLNATTAHVVNLALNDYIKSRISLTDSTLLD